ncbi:hypothetical protein MBAV_002823 [Candidatus Magnetobacterium bavaricum]|uniref:Surface-adhesin protein E-like domain-containing protein n=1 Tax=Candidatus Magnetobacterium bavaricum TaxID=29290 RepID=A0A0F3GWD6_9BACT|nr:hypothetical protein MBAV_002823 [Candidatus Magnetobacterium bavaricum]
MNITFEHYRVRCRVGNIGVGNIGVGSARWQRHHLLVAMVNYAVVLGVVLFAFNSMALDARWKFIGMAENVKFYYDSLTVTYTDKNTVRFWTTQVFPEGHTKVIESRYLNEINCAKRTIRFIQAHIKPKNGKDSISKESSPLMNIAPDTMFEKLHDTVCKK